MVLPSGYVNFTGILEEGQVTVFVAVDHCTTECVGIHAAKRATLFEALEPIRQGYETTAAAFGSLLRPA